MRVVKKALAATLAFAALAGIDAGGAAAACPNEALRVGRSALLPDCRAYEQVSPPDKNGADIALLNEAVAVNGGAITYPSSGGFAGAPSNSLLNQYLSRRGPAGWITEPIVPEFENPGSLLAPEYTGFSPDLSYQMLDASTPASPHYLYRRNPDGSFTTLNPEAPPSEFLMPPTLFAGASEDFSHIIISTHERLTEDAPDTGFDYKLYEWVNGELTLASVAPDGTPTIGAASGIRPISADGSRLYWEPFANGDAPLYLREGGVSRLISKRQTDDSDATGGFLAASRDGSTAYLRSADRLTADASPVGYDLYRYDADSDELVDLTPGVEGGSGPGVQGVVDLSDDGDVVYFVAEGALAPGAAEGQPNLYVRDGAGTRFIASLLPEDNVGWASWAGVEWNRSTQMQVSPDGRTLLFGTAAPIPGYDTSGHRQIYRYELGSGLSCISCRRDGAPSSGDASLTQATASIGINVQFYFPVNNIAAGGAQIFFETTEALLPADTNAKRDVYEWQEQGSGECTVTGGCLHLISSGRGVDHSTFEGASRSGEDVFFLTRERLVGQDRDSNMDVYDARAGGGLAAQDPPPPQSACAGEDCRAPAPLPSVAPPIGSAGFVAPVPKAKRKAHKPKRCKHHRKRGKNGKCKRVNKEAKR